MRPLLQEWHCLLCLCLFQDADTLYYSLVVLASAARRARKTHPPFTSLLPNGSEKGTVFTAMDNILVNTNLRGVREIGVEGLLKKEERNGGMAGE